MQSNVYSLLISSKERWEEIELLLEKATPDNSDCQIEQKFKNSLCRASCVLMVSHLEGFLKDLSKALIDDLNHNLEYKDIPESVRRTACSHFLPEGAKSSAHYVNRLDEEFSNSPSYKLNSDAFQLDNKNPKEDVVRKIMSNFGIQNIFKNLHKSRFEVVFESYSKAIRYLDRMEKVALATTEIFPYNCRTKSFNFKTTNYSGTTLWETFLQDINFVRHKIVHGSSLDSERSIGSIKDSLTKIRLFQYLVTYISCSYVTPNRIGQQDNITLLND
ncbi:HEPN domain-containing protein [Alteromonas sp. OM2203]|uniref:HEPN domain-containing protein n=1 Tax=Alteromonas sp. OM2203 TaxID=3398817 RepID=UPI003AF39373